MNKLDLIRDLTNANGISGFEHEVVDVVKNFASEQLDVSVDAMRNVFLSLKGNTGDRPVVMVDAHSDEIGFMVQSITGSGLIKFIAIGGWPAANIPAHAVRIRNSQGEYIKCITTTKPPHFMSAAEKSAAPSIEKMFIYIFDKSRD